MTAISKYLSPFDAIAKVTFDLPECKSARANRYGIGFGQHGYAGNKHFPDLESVLAGFDAMLVDLRRVYGTPARNWTGRFVEEELEIAEGTKLLRRVRFVPLLKNGKHGKTIHSLYIYPIEVTDQEIARISEALKIPVR